MVRKLTKGLLQSEGEDPSALEGDWEAWLLELFHRYISDPLGNEVPFAQRHRDFWTWIWAIQRGTSPKPFVAVWPRGGAKSTSVELAISSIAARRTRAYGWYVCETQAQADDHVGNVAAMLESAQMARYYPAASSRAVGKYGSSKGWRRNRARTAGGFTLDAIGLDTAARGVKLDEDRPDLIILDDVDGEDDTLVITRKKIRTISRKLLPAGSNDCAILVVQNLVHGDSIVSQLVDGRAEMLSDRTVSGPFPALRDAEYEQREDGKWYITRGTPTWAGQSVEACQRFIHRWGISAFRVECQHEVDAAEGSIFGHIQYRRCNPEEVPWGSIVRATVWVDPAVTDTDQSDAHGIQADALASDGTIYRLFSWEDRTSPEDSLTRAILKGIELKAGSVGVETDQGGDLWEATYRSVAKKLYDESEAAAAVRKGEGRAPEPLVIAPRFASDKAGAGHGAKAHRANLMLQDYERGRIVHVRGTHNVLEAGLRRYLIRKPWDLVDAAYWSWQDLRNGRPLASLGQGSARGWGLGERTGIR